MRPGEGTREWSRLRPGVYKGAVGYGRCPYLVHWGRNRLQMMPDSQEGSSTIPGTSGAQGRGSSPDRVSPNH